MTEEKLAIKIEADSSGVKSGVNNAKSQIEGLSSSVNTSSQKMSNAFSNLGKVIGRVFAITSVLAFGKACVDTATKTQNAWIGLNSILTGKTGTTEAFSKAQTFINEYVKDGLVPLNNAVASYKNLALRGYNSDQIEKTMNALKNSATFARQSTYSLGDAVQTATEGLKNENSVVVDNAGVTKNVAKMWEDYAKSIGKSTNQLTQSEKIIAEVNGIQEETKFQMNDSSLYAMTYSGAIARISTAYTNMKSAIGSVIQPIVKLFTPAIEGALNMVTRLFQAFSGLLSLFGLKSDLDVVSDKISQSASGTKELADDMEEVGDNAEKSGKKAKKGLLAFDEITNINDNSSSSSGIGGGGLSTANVELTETESALDTLGDKVDNVFSDWNLEPLIDSLKRLKESFQPIVDIVRNSLKWCYDNVLVPLGKWSIEKFLPSVINSLASAFNFLAEVLTYIKPVFLFVWDNFLKPLAQFTGDAIVQTFNMIGQAFDGMTNFLKDNENGWNEYWENVGNSKEALAFRESFHNLWLSIQETMSNVWENYVQPIMTKIGEVFTDVYSKHIAPLVPVVLDFFTQINDFLSNVILPIISKVYEALRPVVEWIIDSLGNVLGVIGDVVGGVMTALSGIIQFLTGVFTGDWNKAWEGIKKTFGGIWDGIKGIITGAINGIIYGINKFIKGLEKALNFVIDLINSIEITNPFTGEEIWSPHLNRMTFNEIPKLARGGIVDEATTFIAGEHGKEAIVPLENNTGWLDEIASRLYIMMNESSKLGSDNITIEVPVNLNSKEVARGTLKDLNIEAIRSGYKPILNT